MEIFEVTYKFVFLTNGGRQKSLIQTYRDFNGDCEMAHKKASITANTLKKEGKQLKYKKVLNTAWTEFYE